MKKQAPLAVFCSDLHLTTAAPSCRLEADWFQVQARYLDQLKAIAGDAPIFCAGDVFDRWNPAPELIHFALRHLPSGMYAIPGQHDLPNHRITQMHRSGYGVLKEAGKIQDISGEVVQVGNLRVHGFGWLAPLRPLDRQLEHCVNIALVHHYIWNAGNSYPGAPENCRTVEIARQLRGFDIAVFGDNHKGFQAWMKSGMLILNCGGFIRRKSDEIKYAPAVGVLQADGQLIRQELDTRQDGFQKVDKVRDEIPLNVKQFIDELDNLGECGINFQDAVERHLRSSPDLHEDTRQIILQSLETEK